MLPISEACARKLPAGFARLARGLAIIFVRESAPAASSTAARARSTTASGLGARFVHLQIATAQLFSVEAGNRLGGFFVVGHFHEGKAAGAARLPVHDQVHAGHLSEGLEQRAQLTFRGLKTHVAYKQILHFPLLDFTPSRKRMLCRSSSGVAVDRFPSMHLREIFGTGPSARNGAIFAAPWLRSGECVRESPRRFGPLLRACDRCRRPIQNASG